ncbi:MAG TPA: HPr family phosphocarrier protein [Sedimentisphaerales bacterium]|nr:HPr family phosphocarrier protein [Sedimentisphaerales bacterium]
MENSGPLFLDKELILVGLDVATAEEAIRLLADKMISHGYVKSSFTKAVLKREAAFPTGLPTETPVGLPHTDIEHCLKPGISLGILAQPVEFRMMGDPTQNVNVRLVFLLSVIVPQEQVKVLRRLIDFCQQSALLQSLIDSQTPAEALNILKANLNLEEVSAPSEAQPQAAPETVNGFDIVVTHPVGLHARPAARFVQLASSFPCKITISNLTNPKQPVNAKGIISVLSLGVSQGHRIRVQADGERSAEALQALRALVESNFGEDV